MRKPKPLKILSKVARVNASFQRLGRQARKVPHHPNINQISGPSSLQHHQVHKNGQTSSQNVMSCLPRGMFGYGKVTSSSLHGSKHRSSAKVTFSSAMFIFQDIQWVGRYIQPMGLQAPMEVQVA
jgi:hypothetical protein